jgi:hypothetical protein
MERLTVPDLHVIDYEKGDTLQLILGVDHPRCLDQAEAYRYYYDQFLGHVATHNTEPIILYEGVSIPNDEATEEDCLRSERGEVSLLFRWAQRDDIQLQSFEMDDTDLLAKFNHYSIDPRLVNLYLMMRQHRQWYDMPDRPDFTEYMNGTLERYRKAARELNQNVLREVWPTESFDVDGLIAYFNHIYESNDRQFDIDDKDFYYRMTAKQPNYYDRDHGDPLRFIATEAGRYRQNHITQLIRKHADNKESIFAFAGKPHVKNLAHYLDREMKVISVSECAGKIATKSSHRPKAQNSAPKYMLYEHPIWHDASNTPIIRYAQGDSLSIIVGIDEREISNQIDNVRDSYEEFSYHCSTHETEPVMADGLIELDGPTTASTAYYPKDLANISTWADEDDIPFIVPRLFEASADALFYSLRSNNPDLRHAFFTSSLVPTYESMRQPMDEHLTRGYQVHNDQAKFHQHSTEVPSTRQAVKHYLRLFEHYYGEPLPAKCRIGNADDHALSAFPARFPDDYAYKVGLTHYANVIDQHAREYKSVFMYVDKNAIKDLVPRLHRNRLQGDVS